MMVYVKSEYEYFYWNISHHDKSIGNIIMN